MKSERRNLLEYFTYIQPTIQSGDQKFIATMVSTMNHSFEVVPVVSSNIIKSRVHFILHQCDLDFEIVSRFFILLNEAHNSFRR